VILKLSADLVMSILEKTWFLFIVMNGD